MSKDLAQDISKALSSFSFIDKQDYSLFSTNKDSSEFLAKSVGNVNEYKKLSQDNPFTETVNVRDKNFKVSNGPNAGAKLTDIQIVGDSVNSKIVATDDNANKYDVSLRTSFIDNSDAYLFKNMLNNSSGGELTLLANSPTGTSVGELTCYGDSKDATMSLTVGSIIVNGRNVDNGTIYLPTVSLLDNTKMSPVTGPELVNIYNRSQENPIGTVTKKEQVWDFPQAKPKPDEIGTQIFKGSGFNSKAGNIDVEFESNAKNDYTFKIGDVILQIPPTHVTVTELRSTDSIEMLNFTPMDTSNPVARVVIKINTVFSGKHQIDGDLKRLITQFKYVPFNIIHSYDLVNILGAEDSFIALQGNSSVKYVPVTMDEYTLYTVEGHPNSLGCTLQFTLFNYLAYFDGSKSETLQYEKAFFDETGKLVIPPGSSAKTTTHLENAIHPYNFDIEDILSREDKKFFTVQDNALGNESYHTELGSYARIYKVTAFQDVDMKIINNVDPNPLSEVRLLCNSMSIRYENVFAWHQVIGYPHACAQYIGPGVVTAAINAKVSLDEVDDISRLFKTYQSTRSLDYNAQYDDRYFITSSLTNFADCTTISISDIAVTSLPQHPGYADLNLVFKRSPYLSDATQENNKVAQLDMHWGMQRISRAIEHNPALKRFLEEEDSKRVQLIQETYGYVAQWIANAYGTDINMVSGISIPLSTLINKAVELVIINYYERDNAGNIAEFFKDSIKYIDRNNGINMKQYYSFLHKSFTTLARESSKVPGLKFVFNENRAVGKINFSENIESFKKIEYIPALREFCIGLIDNFSSIILLSESNETMQGLTIADQLKELFDNIIDQESLNRERKNLWKLIRGITSNIQTGFDFTKIPLSKFAEMAQATQSTIYVAVDKEKATEIGLSESQIREVVTELVDTLNGNRTSVANVRVFAQKYEDSSLIHFAELATEDTVTYQSVDMDKSEVKLGEVTLELIEDVSRDNAFPLPFAAHRYYPKCDEMISTDPRFSVTVGSYYYNKIQDTSGHFRDLVYRMKQGAEDSISPAFDFNAWKGIWPEKTKPDDYANNAITKKDPFWLMNAIVYPQARKDMSFMKETEGGTTASYSSPMMYMSGADTVGSTALGDKNPDNNKPFSGYSSWIFNSKVEGELYSSVGLSEVRKAIANKKKTNLDDFEGGSQVGSNEDGETTDDTYKATGGGLVFETIFDENFFNVGVIVDNELVRRSQTTMAALTGRILGEDEEIGLTKYTDEMTVYESSLFRYLTNYNAITKDPMSVIQSKSAISETPTSPIKEENTQGVLVSDKDRIKEELIEVIKTITAGVIKPERIKEEALAGYILEYHQFRSESDKFDQNYINIASAAIKNALNTLLLNSKQDTIFISHKKKLLLSNKELQTHYKFRKLKSLEKVQTIQTDRSGVNVDNISIVSNQIQSYRAVYEVTLLHYVIAILQYLEKEKDADKLVNPFLTFNESHKLQIQLMELPIPDIVIGDIALHESIKETIGRSVLDSGTKSFNIVCQELSKTLDDYIVKSGINDALVGADYQREVSDHNSGMIVNQFMQSMPPTFGMENAFPSYKLYIIDPNLSDIRFHSMDNWYDFRLVKDLMVIKSKEDPAHLLKARIVVDERFIVTTTTFVQRDSDRNNIEYTNKLAKLDQMNTEFDHAFYQGKVPVRPGMRIALKLGYHSDPRLLDTVFIGTITGLQGSMEKNVFQLEAYGDGRELSVPSTTSVAKITGVNYKEIITKVLRSNPAVYHLGRNYGTAIEKFSKEHYLIYSFCRAIVEMTAQDGYKLASLVLGGSDTNFKLPGGTASMSHTLLAAQASGILLGGAKTAAMVSQGASIGAAVGAGALISGGSAAAVSATQVLRLSKKLRDSGWTRLASKEMQEWVDKKFTAYSSQNTVFNFNNYFSGHQFDAEKAMGQVAKHLHDIYRFGHDPVDQNIWAVDIWQSGLTNINNKIKVKINNKKSVWDLLVDIKRVYPDYAIDIRPYGGRSTLYFGPLNWLMFRTDDPVLAMATNFHESSNASVIKQASDAFDELYKTDEFYNNQGNPFPNLVDFQKVHYASSDSNIIFNGIQSTPERGWNAVTINSRSESYSVTANAELHPGIIRTAIKDIDFTNSKNIAQQYALGFLKEGVEKMYGGTLALRGNSKIEPYDRIYVMDAINKMYGWIEVETVIHKFDMNSGFTTHITPNLVCATNADSYKSTAQILRSTLFKEDIAGYLFKAGLGTVAGFAIAGIAAPLAIPIAVLSGTLLLYQGYTATKDAVASTKNILTNLERYQQVEYVDYQTFLHDIAVQSLGADAYVKGAHSGFVLNYVVKIFGNLKDETGRARVSAMSKEMWGAFKNKWEYHYYGTGGFARFLNGGEGNYAGSSARILTNFAKQFGKLVGDDSINASKLKDIADKGLDFTKMEEIERGLKTITDVEDEYKAAVNKQVKDPEKAKRIIEVFDKEKAKLNDMVENVRVEYAKEGTTQAKGASTKPSPIRNTEAAKRIIKTAKGVSVMATLGMLIDAIEAFPRMFETYMVNYMSKANCLTISPLYHKNTMMLAGLDGWQQTNAFLHMKGMILNAKKILSDIDQAILFSTPNIVHTGIRDVKAAKFLADATEVLNAKKKSSGYKPSANGTPTLDTLMTIDLAIKRAQGRIRNPEAKSALNTELVMAFIKNESSWAYDAGQVKHAKSGGLGYMQLVPTWQAKNFIDTAKSMGRDDLVDRIMATGFDYSKYTSGDLQGGYKVSSEGRKVWVDILTDPNNADVNIQAGVNFLADLVNSQTIDGMPKTEAQLVKNVAAKYNGDKRIESDGRQHMYHFADKVYNDYTKQSSIKDSVVKNAVDKSSQKPVDVTASSELGASQLELNNVISAAYTNFTNPQSNSQSIVNVLESTLNNADSAYKSVPVDTRTKTVKGTSIGDSIIGYQTDMNGNKVLVRYHVLNKTNTSITLGDAGNKKIRLDVLSTGDNNTWKMVDITTGQVNTNRTFSPSHIIKGK